MIGRYVLKRIGVGLLQLAGLLVALFFLVRLLPADPVSRFVGFNASPAAYAAAKAHLGLDRPLWAQFIAYAGLNPRAGSGVLEGDLGRSWTTGAPVASELAQALPVTLELVSLSFIVALLAAAPIGTWSALRPGAAPDRATLVYSLFAGSQPEFVWGLIFIYAFFGKLGWAPGPLGRLSPLTTPPPSHSGFITIDSLIAGRADLLAEGLRYLSLPVATLAFVLSGPIIKMVRETMAKTLRSDHVLYARACGLPERSVAWGAFRAALAPSMTLIGVLYGFMLGGAVLVESVFALPGAGQYAVRSILAFDYPAIQGVVLAISALSLGVYLALDLLHAILDPRVTL